MAKWTMSFTKTRNCKLDEIDDFDAKIEKYTAIMCDTCVLSVFEFLGREKQWVENNLDRIDIIEMPFTNDKRILLDDEFLFEITHIWQNDEWVADICVRNGFIEERLNGLKK